MPRPTWESPFDLAAPLWEAAPPAEPASRWVSPLTEWTGESDFETDLGTELEDELETEFEDEFEDEFETEFEAESPDGFESDFEAAVLGGLEAEAGVVTPEITEALNRKDWAGALRLAIAQGWRDDGDLANLVLFARHPELGGRALDPSRAGDAALAREWVGLRQREVWAAIESSSGRTDLGVSGKLAAAGHRQFWGPAGLRFKDLIVAAARDVDLDPALLAASLLAETSRGNYLTSNKMSSYVVGTDDFYERRAALAAAVPAYRRIGWDKKQTPREHLNDAKVNPRMVKTIDFDSGPDALLACAVYLKYGEVALRRAATDQNGDFDALPREVRFALTRMAFAAGPGGARSRLKRVLQGEDVLVRNDAPLKIYATDRNATVRTAQALHLSEWIFATRAVPAPAPAPAPVPALAPVPLPEAEIRPEGWELSEEILTEMTDTVDRLLADQDRGEGESEGSFVGRLMRDVAARIAVQKALDRGERNVNALADAGFAARHPGRPPGALHRDDPRFAELSADWLDVLNRIARPALAAQVAKAGKAGKAPVYNRAGALAYARKYWLKPCDDQFIAVGTSANFVKVPPGTKFEHEFDAAGNSLHREHALRPDGSVIPFESLDDCTHFISCCIGERPGEACGGLALTYRQLGSPPSAPYGMVRVETMVNFLTGKIKGHPRYAEIVAEKSEDTADIGALAPGDLIAYFHIGLRTYTHLAMFLGGGRIACHSYGRSDQPDCTWDQDWNLGQGVPGDPAQPRTHQWTFLRFVV